MRHEHARVAVADAPSPGVENVPARRIERDVWQLLCSPLYAMGLAAGDVIRTTDAATGAFEIVARGGNVCVQFYLGEARFARSRTSTGRSRSPCRTATRKSAHVPS